MSSLKTSPVGRDQVQAEAAAAAVAAANLQDELDNVKQQLLGAHDKILSQEQTIAELASEALLYGTVLSDKHFVIPERFCKGDKVFVIDESAGTYYGRMGTIISDGVDLESGCVRCDFYGIKTKPHFAVGLSNVMDPDTKLPKAKQVQLLLKNDGSNVTITVEGKILEVWNSQRFNPKPGSTAKVHRKTNQIVEIVEPYGFGPLCGVLNTLDDNQIEIESEGGKKVVACFETVEIGDKVVLDENNVIVVRVLSSNKDRRFKLTQEVSVSWDDIGGQEKAKTEIREVVVSPYTNRAIYDFYKKKTRAGFLLYGPPGCGKTLLGKAVATQLAQMYGKQVSDSAFNYVKGPEILSCWVGESEATSRTIFARMRKHYETHGYPGVTFVDECDAVFSERGSSHAQKWHDTLVAMWLAEMDGFDRNTGVIIFATNRPKSLDGAIVRPGRIDYHIKVERPDRREAFGIVDIHMTDSPFCNTDLNGFKEALVSDLYDNVRPIYQVRDGQSSHQQMFTLSDCVSGAMLANICEFSKQLAIRDDLANNTQTGVRLDHVKIAVSEVYQRHQSINHRFDLLDFMDKHGMSEKTTTVDKICAVA